MTFLQKVAAWINGNPGKTVGALIGLIFGILILTIGFLKTFLVVVLVCAGFIIGKLRDDKVPFPGLDSIFKKKE
jgi:uncharacterized membrane protein